MKLFPGHDPIQTLLNKAEQLNQSGQIAAAIGILEKGISYVPNAKSLHYALTEILLENEQYAEALDAIEKLESEALDVRKAELTGACLERLSRFAEAVLIVKD